MCSTLTGYGSGWCTAFFGIPLLEVETKCVACGDEYCEWEIRPVKDWGDEELAAKAALFETYESISQQLDRKSQDLNLLNQNLEQIIKEKTEKNRYLVRVLCHDLLPPLEVIEDLMSVKDIDILKNPKMLSRLQTSVAALRSTLANVRASQVKEMESKREAAAEKDRVGFAEIANYLNAVFYYKLKLKNLKLKITDETQGRSIAGSRMVVLQSVFQNILSNAIKFSPRDAQIEVAASVTDRALVVSVRDHGIGIPLAQREKILTADINDSRTGTQGEVGTGFGLSIVNHFAKELGGTIAIDSTTIDESFEDSGTKITVTLPAA